jgi:cell division protein FtsA
MIIEARVEELLDFVQKELHKIKRVRKLPGGIVLTGGTSKMPGLAEFTRNKLQLASRIAKLENIGGLVDTVEDQAFTVVVGLMLLDMLLLPALPPSRSSASQSAKGILSSLINRIKN